MCFCTWISSDLSTSPSSRANYRLLKRNPRCIVSLQCLLELRAGMAKYLCHQMPPSLTHIFSIMFSQKTRSSSWAISKDSSLRASELRSSGPSQHLGPEEESGTQGLAVLLHYTTSFGGGGGSSCMPSCFFETNLGLFSNEITFPQSRGHVSPCCLPKAITKKVKR